MLLSSVSSGLMLYLYNNTKHQFVNRTLYLPLPVRGYNVVVRLAIRVVRLALPVEVEVGIEVGPRILT